MKIKKILFLTIIIASVLISNNLIHSIYTLWQKKDLMVQAQHELEEEKQKNRELKKQLSLVTDDSFVEQEARDKLFLAKPGEGVVVIPTGVLSASASVTLKPVETKPNWQQWWETFF